MQFSILLTTLTFALIRTQTAIALPAPMGQVEQSAQVSLTTQDQQQLQELLVKQNIQGEECLRVCYPKPPICIGKGTYAKNRPMHRHSQCWTCCVKN
ncbi:uncharacterized protein BDCG_01591 [Blastomyces dermatitidis ER-3]|uniref:Uncharacterized protein n=3 Tax=Blastomyces TaxID=229219 RepID=A0A179UNY6_BLAGS|nr:uncharacterized protein BDBG_04529 [Blastomyces gilchristii SLH14081]XP_045274016.1 uncharacterized protein BDCG_01591 [Blastomyces dermatitidis ER-3]EGE79136.2 hypothetical protein BDDG_02074 [Blastomyces dermatitidis ATCC 18188]EQL37259.1 hypothetical protein BDFG_01517 [Blastomyces dermatitidis ATCC 26199]EEQ86471.2 hypothetical protein BDCG_01591 [Blastomyces dermatitidis ER-3]OAT08938.1 hypothetical protein BDBG_04529 [Blastomyces gilchristii SLH14081]